MGVFRSVLQVGLLDWTLCRQGGDGDEAGGRNKVFCTYWQNHGLVELDASYFLSWETQRVLPSEDTRCAPPSSGIL